MARHIATLQFAPDATVEDRRKLKERIEKRVSGEVFIDPWKGESYRVFRDE